MITIDVCKLTVLPKETGLTSAENLAPCNAAIWDVNVGFLHKIKSIIIIYLKLKHILPISNLQENQS